jgi:hypothetical protein
LDHQDDRNLSIGKDDIISLLNEISGKKWVLNKKTFQQILCINGLLDINLYIFLEKNRIIDYYTYETIAHRILRRCNSVIPLVKHIESFSKFCDDIENIIHGERYPEAYNIVNQLVIETLSDIEENGVCVNPGLFSTIYPKTTIYHGNTVYTQYNIYTSTGRPSNRFDGVNYSALNKDDQSRNSIVSRFGKTDGKLFLYDYSAFHPRIISYLTGFDKILPASEDIYLYLSELYGTDNISEVKKTTFRQLYGGIEEKYENIRYFANLKSFITDQWNFFCKTGYAITPIFGRKITTNHIQQPSPNKLFNYILQAVETEICIPILNKLNRYLDNQKTKPILYTYDSILLDVHVSELDMLKDIEEILKMNNKFVIKKYSGDSYGKLKAF